MRIMWFSNAPWMPTGYGQQTKLFAPRLKDMLGHEVAITAFAGLDGAILNINGLPIYPRHDPRIYGQDVMACHSEHFKADISISLMDAWVCRPDLYGPNVRWLPWYPIDHEPMPEVIREKVAAAYDSICMSRFGQRMATDAGLKSRYIPHGIDTAIYRPGDKAAIREKHNFPQSAFVVGMVAANISNPSRKSLPQHLEAFKLFAAKHSDAILYLHTARGESGASERVDLKELTERLGIDKQTWFADQYAYTFGALPDVALRDVYANMDVLMSVSMGEGFGVPILEAQACGVPVIVGDWTSMPELCFSGWTVDKSDALPYWTPLGAYQWIARPEAIAEKLEVAYAALSHRDVAARKRDQAVAGALPYDVDTITREYWKPLLDELGERIASESALVAPGAPVTPLVMPSESHKLNRAERRILARLS